jgi:hypothetical protein
MIRDNRRAFVGSQSLRKQELDVRREVGIVIREARVVKRLRGLFEDDWSRTEIAIRDAKALAKPVRADELEGEPAAAAK